MKLARVRGNVVSSIKATGLSSHKLLLVDDVHPAAIDDSGVDGSPYIAVDLAGAGIGEIVVVTTGSASRIDRSGAGAPTDAAIVGIVDSVSFDDTTTYYKG